MSEPPHVVEASSAAPPPGPPDVPRRIRLPAPQAAALILFGAVVILATVGVLGGGRMITSDRSHALELSVKHPVSLRHRQGGQLRVVVTNHSGRTLEMVRVGFDTSYLNQFARVNSLPSAMEPWIVEFPTLDRGERTEVHLDLEADRPGRHTGRVEAYAAGTDTVGVPFTTRVLP